MSSAVGERLHITLIVLKEPPRWYPSEYPHIPFIFRNYNHRPTFLPPIIYVYLHWNFFYGWLRKFCLFRQEWRFGSSRSSKVIDFGTNRNCVCNFLLVCHSNLGPILHRYGDVAAFMCSWPHPYSTLILGVFPLHQVARACVKLFGREIIFEVFQPMWSRYLNVTDRQTDGRADKLGLLSHDRALCSIAR